MVSEDGEPVESRNDRFRRLAKVRIKRVADSLRKLGNLSSPNYEYSEEEVSQIFEYIEERVTEAKLKFEKSRKQIPDFTFE